MDNVVDIKIRTDVSAVRPGMETLKNEVRAVSGVVDENRRDWRAMIDEVARTTPAGVSQVERLRDITRQAEEATRRLNAEVRAGARGGDGPTIPPIKPPAELPGGGGALGSEVAGVSNMIGPLKASIVGLGLSIVAAFSVDAVKSFAVSMADASEKTVLMSQRLGLSIPEVQTLAALAEENQASVDDYAGAISRLDKVYAAAHEGGKKQAETLRAIGIDASKSHTNMELLEAAADKFSKMADGPAKVALAMALFGRQGLALLPVLNQGREALQAFNASMDEYGATNEQAVLAGNDLANSLDENHTAMKGVQNVMTQALAPIFKEMVDHTNELIKAFVKSYEEGGIVATAFKVIGGAVEVCGEILKALWEILGVLWDYWKDIIGAMGDLVGAVFGVDIPKGADAAAMAFNIFKDVVVIVKDAVIIALEAIKGTIMTLINTLKLLGSIAADVFTLNWGAIASDWNAGLANIAASAEKSAGRITTAFSEAAKAGQAALNGQSVPKGSQMDRIMGADIEGVVFKKPDPNGGDFAGTGGGAGSKKSGGEKSRMAEWQAKLDQDKLGWAMLQDEAGTAQAYSVQAEADYWKQILDTDKLNSKERADVTKAYLAAHSQLVKQGIDETIAQYKLELEDAKGNSAARIRIASDEAAYVGRMYGEQSKEYKAMQTQIVQIKREAERQLQQLSDISAANDNARLADAIDDAQEAARFRTQIGLQTQQRMLELDRQFEQQRFAIQQQALQRQRENTDPTHDPVRFAQLNSQIEAAERAHQNRMSQIDRQATLERTALTRQSIQQTGQVFGQNIARMLTLQTSFADGVRGIWQGMVGIVTNVLATMIEKWVTQWLTSLIITQAASATTGAAQALSHAAVAGAAAFASTAAIPIIGPALAPAAAAAAYAGAAAFAPLASAAGGWWEIDRDQVAQVHKEEMVLPSWAAKPLRSMLSGPAANTNAPAPANDAPKGGDFHYHDTTGRATPDQIFANRSALAKAIKTAHREGHFAGFKFK